MSKQLLKLMAFCAACMIASVQAQTSSGSYGSSPSQGSAAASNTNTYSGSTSSQGGTSDTSTTDTSSGLGSSSSSTYSSSGLSATGRSSQQHVRASKLQGAEVKSSQGQNLGTISDVIVNPTSGKVEFAVISLDASSQAATSTTGSTTSDSSDTSTTTSSTTGSTVASTSGDKLIPVPWSLLRSSLSAGSSGSTTTTTTTTSTSMERPSFVFTGQQTKLQAAPSFSQSNWPDMSQPTWKQSILSHYGVSASGTATGGSDLDDSSSSTGSSTDSSTSGASGTTDSSSSSSGTSTNDSSSSSLPK